MEKLGGIDLYIANAGFAYYEKLTNPDWEHIAAIMDTNFTGTVYAAEKMKQLHGSEPYSFAVTASAMGLLSLPGYALYSGVSSAFARILSSAFLVKIPAISLPSFFRCDRVMHRCAFFAPPGVVGMKKATGKPCLQVALISVLWLSVPARFLRRCNGPSCLFARLRVCLCVLARSA